MHFQYFAITPVLFSAYVRSIPRSQPAAVEDIGSPSDNSVVSFFDADIPSPTRDDTKDLAFQMDEICPPAIPATPGHSGRPFRRPVCCQVWNFHPKRKGRLCRWAVSWETTCYSWEMQCCAGLKQEESQMKSLVGEDCVPVNDQAEWYPPGPVPHRWRNQNHAPPDSSHQKPAVCKNPYQ